MTTPLYYAHDAHCNTAHLADENPCPPAQDWVPEAWNNQAMLDLIDKVNGFNYDGERRDAIIRTIEVLRREPNLALRLLER